jgi:large subunit ribosomal protein L32
MAVPKRRHSNARTGSRRAHDAKKPRHIMYCSKCSTAVPPHTICPKCGHYMGREIIKTEP